MILTFWGVAWLDEVLGGVEGILMISGDKTVHFIDAFGVTASILIAES